MVQSLPILMQKIIVTHVNPDLDAIAAVWLIRRFVSGWDDAQLRFVPAGETFEGSVHDEVVVVDTGLGTFDHHQIDADTSATKLVFEYLEVRKRSKKQVERDLGDVKKYQEKALSRMVSVINDIDHFRQVYYPDADADYFHFLFTERGGIIDGLNMTFHDSETADFEIVTIGSTILDGIYRSFQQRVYAEKEMEKAEQMVVKTKSGNVLGIVSANDEVATLAQKQGFSLVVRKDPVYGNIRIKALPGKGIDLTPVYDVVLKKDPAARWYLHPSRSMLLNGSGKHKDMKPSSLTMQEIMHIVEDVL